MSAPHFVRRVEAGGVLAEPLTLDEDAQRRLTDALNDVEASRAATLVSGQRYVVLGGGR